MAAAAAAAAAASSVGTAVCTGHSICLQQLLCHVHHSTTTLSNLALQPEGVLGDGHAIQLWTRHLKYPLIPVRIPQVVTDDIHKVTSAVRGSN
jgi:hypothetical protein